MRKLKLAFLGAMIIGSGFMVSCNKDEVVSNEKAAVESNKNTEKGAAQSVYQAVTPEEYKKLDAFQQSIVQKINASVRALEALDDDRFTATISVSKNFEDNFSNAIIISKEEVLADIDATTLKAGSCTVCGIRSAYNCLSKMQDEIGADEFDIHVKRVGDCVKLSWD